MTDLKRYSINHWITILQRIIYFVRRASNDEFFQLMSVLISSSIQGYSVDQLRSRIRRIMIALGVPIATIHYFQDERNTGYDQDSGFEWWMYPDRDFVDWGEPFHVPGAGAAHGAAWDVP